MTALSITPLHEDFGARIEGTAAHSPLDCDVVDELLAAIDCYSFLCIPKQSLNDDLQLAFTKQLGEPEIEHVQYGQSGIVSYLGTIGNVQADGTKWGNRDKHTVFQTGNNMWHSDSSFREVPSFLTVTFAHEVPEEGGETEFVSARAAYKRLPHDFKKRIEPLIVVHDYVFSRSMVSPDAVTPSHAASLPPVRQRLVRTNPGNGEKNFYVGSHAKEIEGWQYSESRRLLNELLDRATRPGDIYAHKWQKGDLVIWDNRCLLHRGRGYDADKYRRFMRQTRVSGKCSTLLE